MQAVAPARATGKTMTMSYDLAVWTGPQPVSDEEAMTTYERLSAQYLETSPAEKGVPTILAYVDDLLVRWPDITSDEGLDTSPWATGPLTGEASGPLLYFGLVYSMVDEAVDFAACLATEHGLVCLDLQTSTLLTPVAQAPNLSERVAVVPPVLPPESPRRWWKRRS